MKQIKLGSSGVDVSAISLGCMRISQLSRSEVTRLIDDSLSYGINFFDHADIYGDNGVGEAETQFGKVLKDKPSLRGQMFLQSKCGIVPGVMFDFSREHILASVEGSLGRLSTDHLDMLLLHRPDTLIEPEEVAEAFRILHDSGKVRFFGVSNMNPGQIKLLQQATEQRILANQLQLSAAFTGMIDAGFNVNMTNPPSVVHDDGILEYCRRKQITIQTWSSIQYGFFEGTFLGSDKYPKLNAVLDRIAKEQNVTSSAVAIAWILRHPANMQAIIGTTNPARLAAFAKAADVTLSRKEWYEVYMAAGNELP